MSIPFYGDVELNNNLSVKGNVVGSLTITDTTITQYLQIRKPRTNIGQKQYPGLTDHPGSSAIIGWNRVPSGLFVYTNVDGDTDQNKISFINKPGGANWFNMLHVNGCGPDTLGDAGIMQIAGDFAGRLFFRNGNHHGWYSESNPTNGGWRELIDSSGGQTIRGSLTLHPTDLESLMIHMDTQYVSRAIRFITNDTSGGSDYKTLGQLAWHSELILSSNIKPVLISSYLLNGEWKGLRVDSKKIQFFDKEVITGCKFEAYQTPASGMVVMGTSNDFLIGEMRLLHVWRDTTQGKKKFQFELPALSGKYICALLVVSSDDDHNDMWLSPASYSSSSINSVLLSRSDSRWAGDEDLDDNFIGAYLWIKRTS